MVSCQFEGWAVRIDWLNPLFPPWALKAALSACLLSSALGWSQTMSLKIDQQSCMYWYGIPRESLRKWETEGGRISGASSMGTDECWGCMMSRLSIDARLTKDMTFPRESCWRPSWCCNCFNSTWKLVCGCGNYYRIEQRRRAQHWTSQFCILQSQHATMTTRCFIALWVLVY